MVPLADIFNHKAAIVQLHGDLEIEPICFADSVSEEGSEQEGSEQESSQSDDKDDDEPSTSGVEFVAWLHAPDFYVICSVWHGHADDENERSSEQGQPLTRGAMLIAAGESLNALRLEIGICSTSTNGREVLEVRQCAPSLMCMIKSCYEECVDHRS